MLALAQHLGGGIEALALQLGELCRTRLLELGTREVLALGALQMDDVFEVARELLAALLGASTRLRELEHLDLLRVHLRLQRLQLAAQAVDAFLQLARRRLGHQQCVVRQMRLVLARLQLGGKALDLALALDHAVGARIRGVVDQGAAGQDLSARPHQAGARCQLRAPRQPVVQPLHRPRAGQEVTHQPAQGRIAHRDQARKRPRIRACRRSYKGGRFGAGPGAAGERECRG